MNRTEDLKEFLMEIQRQIDRATSISRTEALKAKETDTMDRVPLVVTYHPDLPCLSKICQKHLPILHIFNKMRLAVPNFPLVAYRRAHNFKDQLVRAQGHFNKNIRTLANVEDLAARPVCL